MALAEDALSEANAIAKEVWQKVSKQSLHGEDWVPLWVCLTIYQVLNVLDDDQDQEVLK